jgi:hypothetical protein
MSSFPGPPTAVCPIVVASTWSLTTLRYHPQLRQLAVLIDRTAEIRWQVSLIALMEMGVETIH